MYALSRRLLPMVILALAVGALAACGSGSSSSGQRPADRTVQVRMTDQLRFEPSTLTVKAGETVQFQVENAGTQAHEFVVGDQAMQDQHEQEMRGGGGMSGMHMSDTTAVDVPPGQTRTLTFTFPTAPGSYLYGCHVNGHYAGGMRGTITIG